MTHRIFTMVGLLALAALLVSGTGCSGGNGGPIIMRFSHELSGTTPKGMWAAEFASLVEEYTQGEAIVEVYPSGQLYQKESDALAAAAAGTIELAAPLSGMASGLVPTMSVLDLPFLVQDHDTWYSLLDGPIGQDLLQAGEEKGIRGLAFIPNVAGGIFNSKRPLRYPDDFEDLKLRVPPMPVLEANMSALGANVIAMPAADVYMALKQGSLEGVVTSGPQAVSGNYWEGVSYCTVSTMAIASYPVFINLEFWNGLPDDVREAVDRAALEATTHLRSALGEIEAEAWQTLEDNGVEIYYQQPEEVEVWREATMAVYDQFQTEEIEDLVERILELG